MNNNNSLDSIKIDQDIVTKLQRRKDLLAEEYSSYLNNLLRQALILEESIYQAHQDLELLSTHVACPLCGNKTQRKDIVLHHDHFSDVIIKDALKKLAKEKCNTNNWQVLVKGNKGASKYICDLTEEYQRFAKTPICSRCNSIDGNLKQQLNLDSHFTFTPEQIKTIYEKTSQLKSREQVAIERKRIALNIYHNEKFILENKKKEVLQKLYEYLKAISIL